MITDSIITSFLSCITMITDSIITSFLSCITMITDSIITSFLSCITMITDSIITSFLSCITMITDSIITSFLSCITMITDSFLCYRLQWQLPLESVTQERSDDDYCDEVFKNVTNNWLIKQSTKRPQPIELWGALYDAISREPGG